MKCARPICLRLFVHWMACPFIFARARAGNSRPARIAIIAITTSSSIRVKAKRRERKGFIIWCQGSPEWVVHTQVPVNRRLQRFRTRSSLSVDFSRRERFTGTSPGGVLERPPTNTVVTQCSDEHGPDGTAQTTGPGSGNTFIRVHLYVHSLFAPATTRQPTFKPMKCSIGIRSFLLLSTASLVLGGDWPQWRGPH